MEIGIQYGGIIMQYRTMPGSEEKLSVLGFGCMRLPTLGRGSNSPNIDIERAKAQIRMAIDAGVNYIDTAWPYHMMASEPFLGEHVLKDGYREKVKLATKLPCFLIKKQEQFEDYLTKQLNKLQTDHIDYYLMHALNYNTWSKMVELGIKDFMDRIRKDGRVRHIGFSFHSNLDDFKKIVDEYDWEFCQVQYNILDENFQAGIQGITYAYEHGLGVIVMEPLRGGSLVKNIPDKIQDIYDKSGFDRKPADWALSWVWNNPMVTLVLSGMNEEEHIKENIAVASRVKPNSLSEKELAVIKAVKDMYQSLLQVGCTGCGYCVPCPVGINIPGVFKNLNNYHMFSKRKAVWNHILYNGVFTRDGKPHWTSICIDCGACESKCPQGLEIRKEFKHVRKHLEGPGKKFVAAIIRKYNNRKRKRKAKKS